MAVTMTQVRAALDPEEPNYSKAAQLGPQALPHLKKLVAEGEPMLASKATYLTALIGGEDAVELLRDAATHTEPIVRVAAAGAARVLPAAAASEVLVPLLTDADSGVRRAAMKAVPEERSDELRDAVEEMARRDPDARLRAMSLRTLGKQASEYPGIETGPGAGEGGGDILGAGTFQPASFTGAPGGGEGGGDILGAGASQRDASNGGSGAGEGGGGGVGGSAAMPRSASASSKAGDGEGGGDFRAP